MGIQIKLNILSTMSCTYVSQYLYNMDRVSVDQICMCRSQWPLVLRRGSAVDRLLGLRVRIAPEE